MSAALLALAKRARLASQDLPSPCVSVCRMREDNGLCEGCFRSIAEITAWSRSSDADKRRVWGLIEQRARLSLP